LKLSIIIVSYNVRYFLEEALASLERATVGIESEILVVDNASADDSVVMVKDQFPNVKLIEFNENLGFGKANNLGLKLAQGEYILFLNPDTIVSQDCLKTCIQYMDQNLEYGACGVKMIDGSGQILPESKRGFPTPWVSFCKMLGLHQIFPKSSFFNGYYLGHLSYDSNQDIEVLSGAFFFVRKSILELTGGFDEQYFMYGEDIDLSTKIRRSGFKIAYLSDTKIVHYKGESTKKSSLSYYKSFYEAMLIFTKNYFSGPGKNWFLFLLKIAIVFKGAVSWLKGILSIWILFLLDAAALLTGIFIIKKFWSNYYFHTEFYFERNSFWINAALFSGAWLLSFFFNGLYERKPARHQILMSAITGFIFNLMIYALLPESVRSSRMILLLSFIYILIYLLISRSLIYFKSGSKNKTIELFLVGSEEECAVAENLLQFTNTNYRILRRFSPESILQMSTGWKTIIKLLKPDQIIIGSANQSLDWIMQMVSSLPDKIEIRLLTTSKNAIIGSSSKNTPGELHSMDLRYHIEQTSYKRQKRVFDILFSAWLIFFFLVIVFFQKNKFQFIINLLSVITGKKSWVGLPTAFLQNYSIPKLKNGILTALPFDQNLKDHVFSEQYLIHYAIYYSVWMDLDICLRNIQSLDKN